MSDLPIRLAGRGELHAIGFAGAEFGKLLIRERSHHVFKMIIRRLADDFELGDLRARGVREGLSRLAESSILERYV